MSELQTAQKAAESEWLDKWTEGPREKASRLLSRGTSAPDLALSDEAGTSGSWRSSGQEDRPWSCSGAISAAVAAHAAPSD